MGAKREPRVGEARLQFKLMLTRAEYEYLRAHAFRRDVNENRLAVDILVSWLRRATPRTDPVFAPESLGFRMPPYRTEPYPGYRDSLLFFDESELEVDDTAPPPRTPAERAAPSAFPDDE